MSIGSFIFGLFLMGIGLLIVMRTDAFLEYFGDVQGVVGGGDRWSSWKIAGIAIMLFGFLFGFGLLQLVFLKTIGRFFNPTGLP